MRRRIGAGGVAEVFEAVRVSALGFERRVAIKRLLPGWSKDAAVRCMFIEEAKLAARLHHPGIVAVLDVGVEDGAPYHVLEYVDGIDLRRLSEAAARAGQPVPIELALHIAGEVAQALDHAHAALDDQGQPLGLVHRDVKPSNILVSWTGDVKLCDFGIAWAERRHDGTADAVTGGTPHFMAPEQGHAQTADRRADVYGLGRVLAALVSAPLPEDVATIIAGATRHRPDERHGSAGEVAAELAAACAARGLFAPRARLVEWLAAVRLSVPTTGRLDELVAGGSATAIEQPATGDRAERVPLIGRAPDLDAIDRALERSRLVTVTGPPGVGKTRLAQHLAGRRRAADAGRSPLQVTLRFARSGEEAVAAVAAAAGVPLSAQAISTTDQVGHALAERGELLLVLDDVEHLVGAADATIGRWLEIAPELRCLTTSRHALGIAGERRHELGPLAAGDALELFATRVQAVRAGFDPTGPARAIAAEIVARLDHLPLAIELAAARAVILSLEEIRDRLARHLDFLRVEGGHRIGARHGALREALEWSWSLLGEDERIALAALAVFDGPFSAEAAVAVLGLGEWESLDRLAALRERSLLQLVAASGAPPGVEEQVRFELLASVQELAGEKLAESGAELAVRRRHAAHYLERSAAWVAALAGADAAAVRRQIARESSNLAAALRVALRETPRLGVERSVALGEALETNTLPALDPGLFDELVATAAGLAGAGALHPRTLLLRGDARAIAGRLAEATADLEEAARIGQAAQDRWVEGHARRLLGILLRDAGRLAIARDQLERASELFAALGDQTSLGNTITSLGTLLRQAGHFAAARNRYARAREHHRQARNHAGEGLVLAGLGHLALASGDRAEASVRYRDALVLVQAAGDRRTEGVVLHHLAMIELERGNAETAVTHLDRARERLAAVGDRRLTAMVTAYQAVALAAAGRQREGAESLAAAGLALTWDDARIEAMLAALRASFQLALAQSGDLTAARRVLDDVTAAERRLATPDGEDLHVEYTSDARRLLASLLAAQGV